MQIDNKNRLYSKIDIFSSSILFSKIRIVRNFAEYSFVKHLSSVKKKKLEDEIIDFISSWKCNSNIVDISKLDINQMRIFQDENLLDKIYCNVK